MDLIVTCARYFEDETKDEVKSILNELGDSAAKIEKTEFSGILTADTSIDYTQIIKKIHQKMEDEPWSIRYILRVIPIFKTVKTDLTSISEAVLEQIQKMGPTDTYRITIEKRSSSIASAEIISQVADKIKNKVSLKKYDWIVLIEILGNICGVSIIRESEILSVEKTRRKSFD